MSRIAGAEKMGAAKPGMPSHGAAAKGARLTDVPKPNPFVSTV